MTHNQTVATTDGLMLETVRKTAFALYRILTIGSIDLVYGKFDNAELRQSVLYKMQTRTQFYVTHFAGVPFAQMLHIKDQDLETVDKICNILFTCTADDIRQWWNCNGGKVAFKKYQLNLAQFEIENRRGFVFRVNDQGFARNNNGIWSIEIRPEDATAWDYISNDHAEVSAEVQQMYERIRLVTMNKDKLPEVIIGDKKWQF